MWKSLFFNSIRVSSCLWGSWDQHSRSSNQETFVNQIIRHETSCWSISARLISTLVLVAERIRPNRCPCGGRRSSRRLVHLFKFNQGTITSTAAHLQYVICIETHYTNNAGTFCPGFKVDFICKSSNTPTYKVRDRKSSRVFPSGLRQQLFQTHD